jgi:hypothetical protein
MTSRMRVVSPDERKPPKSLAEAVEGGDYLQILLAQRRDIVRSLPDEKGQAKATRHLQLRDISKEIEGMELAAAGDKSVVADTDDDAWDQSAI